MRKQTKLVAVASAAALLAIGASMTSFAATGWVEENGEWFYYEKDGSKAEDAWKKSGDKWFWLDSEENGAMAIDKLVVDDDNTYYVDSTGAMVANTWVKVVNEEQDDEDDPAEYNYYYMQSNGKAYKTGDDNATRFKTIDGKRYSFDADGKMLYGWVNGQSERLSGDDEWANESADVYYLGNWDDGAMKTGWQKISVYDDSESDDMDYWFWFKSNGKRFYNDKASEDNVKEKKVNGKKYGFDKRGVMVYEWMIASGTSTSSATVSNWQYFRSPEDGARVTKGWFKVIAPNEDNTFNSETFSGSFATEHADDESEQWYYADGDGELYEGAIKKIKGKYYGFRPDSDTKKGAAMLNGLCLLNVENDKIVSVIEADMDSDTLDDIINEEGDFDPTSGSKAGWLTDTNTTLYYFGNDADSDGSMKTGTTTINLDGDSFNFSFSKSGGAEGKGRGLTGVDDEKYIYKYGMRIKADSDDKYRVIAVVPGILVDANGDPVLDENGDEQYGGVDTSSKGVSVNKIKSSVLREGAIDLGTNKNGETVRGLVAVDDTTNKVATTWGKNFYLVNTTGAISKKKTAAKDGDDWYFYVNSDKEIVMYLNNKTITGDKDHTMDYDLSNWDDVK